MAATASTMLMLLRPCGAVHRHVRILGQGKAAFLTTSARRNVFSSPRAKLVQEEQQHGDGPSPRMVKGFRCESTIAGQPEESSLTKSMANKIKDQLSAETVIVNDVSGDGQHVSIYAVSSAFEGQSAVNRQRMVYKAIWEELQSTVHAVDHMVTRTPAEAGLDQQSS